MKLITVDEYAKLCNLNKATIQWRKRKGLLSFEHHWSDGKLRAFVDTDYYPPIGPKRRGKPPTSPVKLVPLDAWEKVKISSKPFPATITEATELICKKYNKVKSEHFFRLFRRYPNYFTIQFAKKP